MSYLNGTANKFEGKLLRSEQSTLIGSGVKRFTARTETDPWIRTKLQNITKLCMTHGPGPVARDGFEIDKLVPGYHQCIVYSTLGGLHCIVYRVIIPSRCIIGLSFIPSNTKVFPLPEQMFLIVR